MSIEAEALLFTSFDVLKFLMFDRTKGWDPASGMPWKNDQYSLNLIIIIRCWQS